MVARHLLGGALALLAASSMAACDQSKVGKGSAGESDLSCSSRRDCTYDIVPVVQKEADCSCPQCPVDAPAVARSVYEERAKAFAQVCGAWSKTHACPPTFCSPPPRLSCVAAQCSLEGQQGGLQ